MVIVRTLILDPDDEPAARAQSLPKMDRLQNESSSSLVSNRSPFRQLKDNLKQIMTGLKLLIAFCAWICFLLF